MRNRLVYSAAGLLVIMAGLASRRYAEWVPSILGKYPGDALWTVLMFCIIGIALPKASPFRVFTLAVLVSFAVEFAQLIRWKWLVALRKTTLGHLALGSTFGIRDLFAYLAGGLVALVSELSYLKLGMSQRAEKS